MTENLSPRHSSLRFGTVEQKFVLILGDMIASVIALLVSLMIWRGYFLRSLLTQGYTEKQIERFFSFNIQAWVYVLPVVWILLLIELYEPQVAANRKKTQHGILVAGAIAFVVYAVIFIAFKDPTSLPRIVIGAFLILSALLTWFWRLLYIWIYTAQGMTRRILIVGAGKAGTTLAKVYNELDPKPFYLVGFSDDDPNKVGTRLETHRVLGRNDNLVRIIKENNITDIVVAINGTMMGSTFQTILDVQEGGVMVSRMPTVYEEITGRVPIHHLETDWLIRSFVDETRVSAFYELGKRLMDVLGALVGVAIFVLTLPFVALAIALETGFPIFYEQERLGKGGKLFMLYKYRTMIKDAEPDGEARPAKVDDPRITKVGSFLRKTRLDEFPQFFNILRGEMSLIGPRAEREQLVETYQKQIPFYRARLLVKPGMSGWAQITQGYTSTVFATSLKLEYDLYYIKHRTIGMDITILLRTFTTVFGLKGR